MGGGAGQIEKDMKTLQGDEQPSIKLYPVLRTAASTKFREYLRSKFIEHGHMTFARAPQRSSHEGCHPFSLLIPLPNLLLN